MADRRREMESPRARTLRKKNEAAERRAEDRERWARQDKWQAEIKDKIKIVERNLRRDVLNLIFNYGRKNKITTLVEQRYVILLENKGIHSIRKAMETAFKIYLHF